MHFIEKTTQISLEITCSSKYLRLVSSRVRLSRSLSSEIRLFFISLRKYASKLLICSTKNLLKFSCDCNSSLKIREIHEKLNSFQLFLEKSVLLEPKPRKTGKNSMKTQENTHFSALSPLKLWKFMLFSLKFI